MNTLFIFLLGPVLFLGLVLLCAGIWTFPTARAHFKAHGILKKAMATEYKTKLEDWLRVHHPNQDILFTWGWVKQGKQGPVPVLKICEKSNLGAFITIATGTHTTLECPFKDDLLDTLLKTEPQAQKALGKSDTGPRLRSLVSQFTLRADAASAHDVLAAHATWERHLDHFKSEPSS